MLRLAFIGASIILSAPLMSDPAAAVGERPYWPAYEYREVPDGCIKWNWQELSYYNYCGRVVHPYRSKVLRVRG